MSRPVLQSTEWRAIDDLRLYDGNPRTHPDAQVRVLAENIDRFSWTHDILIDADDNVIAGHGRILAARRNGYTEVPVKRLADLSPEEVRALRLADNQVGLMSGWDEARLAEELERLRAQSFDLDVTGFDRAAFVKSPKEPAPAPEEPPAKPVTKPGDLWQLGRHRLVCGDCTVAETVGGLLEDGPADLVLTDPPYCSGGFQEAGRSAGSVGTDAVHKQVANDRLSTRGYQSLLKHAVTLAASPFAYVFTDWRMWVYLFDIVESCGLGVRSMIVWDKGTPGWAGVGAPSTNSSCGP